jgi:sporulation protein YlmC with PRC-barrel domain
MRIQLGAAVKTVDGHRAGNVSKVVWDPERNEIRDFILTTGGLFGHDVVVSRDVLEAAKGEADELVIDITKTELDQLDRYDERAYAPPPFEWMSPAESNYEADAFLFPTVSDAPTTDMRATNAAADRRRPTIRKGMPVADASGQRIGAVDELRVDDMTGELRAIVLRGAGEERREIAADQLDIGTDEVHVISDATAKREI